MIKKESRNEMRVIRHARIRKQIIGTKDVPRLNVYRSNKNILVQLIDDEAGVTLASASVKGKNIEAATKAGEAIAKAAKKAKISKVVFDRSGYLYHGRVKALADAARENGLEF
jgi:large subunit ribosomal protein L18